MNDIHDAPRHRLFSTRTRRLGRGILLGVLALATIGATYQTLAARADLREYPAPGQLVDVGGYRLHIHCVGEQTGGPTMVLDHGGGGLGALDWAYVQPELARFGRVCAYDRGGYGWSDASPRPRTLEHEVDELRLLLDGAEIPGPYLLVADSLGGYTSRQFATLHPQDVAGLVLVDTTTENTWTSPEIREFNAQFGLFTSLCRASTPIGLWRVLGRTGLLAHPFPALLPPEQQDVALALTLSPHYCRAIDEETDIGNLDISAEQLRTSRRPLGDLPILILTAGAGYPDDAYREHWLADQVDLLGLSTRSAQRIIADATHVDILTDRAAVVVEGVREVLAVIE